MEMADPAGGDGNCAGPGDAESPGNGGEGGTHQSSGLSRGRRFPKEPLKLVLREFEMQKLHILDIHAQNFQAMFWIEFVIPGGFEEPSLSKEGIVFPVDSNGVPLFKPSAGWYMSQMDFPNALSLKTLSNKIIRRQHHRAFKPNDVIIELRYEGKFQGL